MPKITKTPWISRRNAAGGWRTCRDTAGKWSARRIAAAGLIAAVYAVLTVLLPIPQYGAVQLRVAEAMTVLPFLFPEAVPGLVAGCFLANLFSPFLLDCVFGTLATLIAAVWTSRVKHPILAPLPPVICNAVIVGAEIAWFAAGEGENFWRAYAFNALTVGAGEAVACYLLGTLLLAALARVPFPENPTLHQPPISNDF